MEEAMQMFLVGTIGLFGLMFATLILYDFLFMKIEENPIRKVEFREPMAFPVVFLVLATLFIRYFYQGAKGLGLFQNTKTKKVLLFEKIM